MVSNPKPQGGNSGEDFRCLLAQGVARNMMANVWPAHMVALIVERLVTR